MNIINFFRNLNIRNKILSSYILILLLLFTVAFTGYKGISEVKRRVDRANEVNLIVTSIKETQKQEKNYMLFGDESYISLVNNEIQQILNQAGVTKEKFRRTENKNLMDTVISAVLIYREAFNSYVDAERSKITIMEDMRKSSEDVLKTTDEFYVQQQDQLASDIRAGFGLTRIQERISKADDANQIIKLYLEARKVEKEYIISGEQEWYNAHEELIDKTLSIAGEMKPRLRESSHIIMIDKVMNELDLYRENWYDFVNLMHHGNQVGNEMKVAAQNAQKKCEEAYADQQTKMLKQITAATTILLSIILITVFIAIIIAFLLAGSISKPLNNITETAVKISSGDLRVELNGLERSDEIGVLSDAFKNMVFNLKNQIRNITEAVNVLTSMVSEIIATSSQLTASSTETVTAISETTTTVEEVKQTAQLNNDKAKAVSESSRKTLQVATDGENAVNETGTGMSHIREKMEFIADSIMRLSEQSQAIGEIINVINDLAEQSNLLAVNASIEAAKAGEEGKGFSVVAEEVKSLADQSKQATKQVREILTDIQKATSTAVLATEEGSKVVEAGISKANDAGASIKVLAEVINEAVQATTQIGASVQQQFVGVDQVTEAIRNISVASNQNLESTKQLEEASEKLNGLAKNLEELIEHYQL